MAERGCGVQEREAALLRSLEAASQDHQRTLAATSRTPGSAPLCARLSPPGEEVRLPLLSARSVACRAVSCAPVYMESTCFSYDQ